MLHNTHIIRLVDNSELEGFERMGFVWFGSLLLNIQPQLSNEKAQAAIVEMIQLKVVLLSLKLSDVDDLYAFEHGAWRAWEIYCAGGL